MTLYWVGDKPKSLVIEPEFNGDFVDLEEFTSVSAALRDPLGELQGGLTALIEEDTVIVSWPEESLFTAPGLYKIQLTLIGAEITQRADPKLFVVQEDSAWYTIPELRQEWSDAPADDVFLYQLLETSKADVLAWAPALEEDEPLPISYRLAQKMQCRNRLNAVITRPDSGIGDGDHVFRPFPLDWQIKQLIRPKRAIPVAK